MTELEARLRGSYEVRRFLGAPTTYYELLGVTRRAYEVLGGIRMLIGITDLADSNPRSILVES